jgi:hypothetical protein
LSATNVQAANVSAVRQSGAITLIAPENSSCLTR